MFIIGLYTSFNPLKHSVRCVTITVSHIKKQKHREVKLLDQGGTASDEMRFLNPGGLTQSPYKVGAGYRYNQ